jgi:peptidoglycan/LPS O-acetylase OafA/YrhL
MEKSSTRYLALDGWRGIAAIGVAAFHFSATNHFYPLSLIRNASLYVDFFFVLSGFVIAHTYSRRVRTVHDAVLYIVRRFGRLWPLHVFTLACLVFLEAVKWIVVAEAGLSAGEEPFSSANAAWAIPAHLAFLQSFGLFDDYTWNGPSWSIGAEFWTYIVFAGVCLAGQRSRTVWPLGLALLGFVVLAFGHHANLTATHDLGFFRGLLGFFTGVLTYRALTVWSLRPESGISPTLMEGGIVGIAVLFLVTSKSPELNPYFRFLSIPIFSAMILVFAKERGTISRWLLTRPVQSLGRWSYSIYMIHFVLLTLMNSGLRAADKVFGTAFTIPDPRNSEPLFCAPLFLGDAMFFVYLAIVIVCASLTWRYVEEPWRLYFNTVARRRKMSGASRPGLQSIPALPPSE